MSEMVSKHQNQIHSKGIYSIANGLRIEFIHDHLEKTFDAWEVNKEGQKRLIESQPSVMEPFGEFQDRILAAFAQTE